MAQFPASLDLASLNGLNGFTVNGELANDISGTSVASAGDVNGDGFADIIVGAIFADPHGDYSGASYVVFGKAGGFAANLDLSSLTGANGFKISGVTGGDTTGRSVASAGDVNGDGFADLIIGADGAAPHGVRSGASYVVFGKAQGFTPNLDLSTLNGATGFKISGEAANDYSGSSVASAGDVNGDGFADLIIGAPDADPHGSGSGASYVVFGRAGGFTPNLDLSTLTGANGFKISGVAAGDHSGWVASAGDVNGDGFADLIVGAYAADPHGIDSGASYVVFGHAGGFAANLDLSALTGGNGFKISGEAAGDISGSPAASAGDVNGDGFADLIIGAFRAGPHGINSGASYVVFGHAGGFAANLDLSALNGANGFKISGEAAGDYAGRSVASAGDINGDGFADLIIGANYADPHGIGSGASYVVFGKAGGFTPNLELSTLSGANGFKISGNAVGDHIGVSVASGGDVNDDGFSDLLIGANGADPAGRAEAGSSYVIFGAKPDTAVTRVGTNAKQTLAGGDFNDTLFGLGGNDRLFGHGGKDKMDGGTGDDYLRGGLGRDTMTGGAGRDVFDFNSIKDTGKAAAKRDVITDFKHKTDDIDLKDIDANSKKPGDQAFKFIGTADFHHKAGELHYVKINNPGAKHDMTIVSGDTNGDGKADFQIELSHLVTLTKVDFIL